MTRPTVITLLALAFAAAAIYLLGAGLILILRPGTIAMARGSDLLSGLETAGPMMFLIGAALYGITGIGLWKLHPLARHAAVVIAAAGAALAIPAISSAVTGWHLESLARQGFPLIVRVLVIFFLWQRPTAEAFHR